MPDIPQPTGLPPVEPRRDGRGQGADGRHPGPPAKRVAETYQEVDRVKPPDDRVTIIGIPLEQITSSTRAALAGLVAENATLRAQVRRLEAQRAADAPPVLEGDAFVARLGALLAAAPAAGQERVLVIVHVQTYEDIRRSTGLLAANTALADVAHRLREIAISCPPGDNVPVTAPATTTPLQLVGLAGGLSLAALVEVAAGTDPAAIARQVRDGLCANGYDVAGLSMALAIKVAAATVSAGESALLALARTDHLTRGPQAVS